MTVFETERLLLRHFTPEDAPLVLELLNDPLWIRFIGDRNVRTLEDAGKYLEKPISSYKEHGYGLYHVARKSDMEPLGMCGLVKRDTLPHADIGFAFLERFRGEGYAREAAQGTLAFARATLGLGRILAIVSPSNERSASLLAKLGFEREQRSVPMNGNERDPVDLWASQPRT
jgi:RimJ/RimL family protein N-acetyltransferase